MDSISVTMRRARKVVELPGGMNVKRKINIERGTSYPSMPGFLFFSDYRLQEGRDRV